MVSGIVYADTAPVGSDLTVVITRLARPGPTPPADGGDSRSIILSDGSQYAETTFGTPMSVLARDVIRFDVATVGSATPGGNWLNVSLKLVPA